MGQYKLNDLVGVLSKLGDKLRTDCAGHDISSAGNIEAFGEFYKEFIDAHDRIKLDAASDQVALILSKSDDTACNTLVAAVVIVLDAHQAMKSFSTGDMNRCHACIQSALNSYATFK